MSVWIPAREAFQHVLSIELIAENARRKIERRIRDGDLPARAAVLDYDDVQGQEIVVPPAFWRHEMSCLIDFEANTVVREKWHREPSWSPRASQPATLMYVYKIEGLEFSRRHLFDFWPAIQGSAVPTPQPASTSRKGVGGAPTKYDWATAAGYMAKFIVDNDPQRSDALKALKDWFQERDQEPDKRDLEKFIKEIWTGLNE